MAIPFGSDINLNKNEIQNAIWHKLSGAPSNPVEGQFYYDMTSKRLKYYNGSSWVTVGYSADILSTARTITFAGDTTGSFTFDGSTNKSVDIQVKDDSHYHSAASITDSAGYNSASSIAPLYQAKINESRACRTAFTPASAVKIEYSTDGGATWKDYGASDSQKRELFAMNRGVNIYIGGNATGNENVTTNMQTRVTVSPTDRYAGVNQAYIYLSTIGHSCKVDIERSTIGNKEKFTKIRENVTVSGWGGPNIVNFIYGTYGGGSSQTSNYYSYRFTFKISAVGSTQAYIKNKPYINDIRMYGSNIWGIPNRMSFTDHLYLWDINQNAIFPASVRTSTTPTSNDDLTNKKYVDSLASSTLSSSKSYTDTKSTKTLLDVDSLPEITNDNRNRIIRYNGKLYSVSNKYTGTAQDLSVGADLSSAKLILSFPDTLYSSGYSGAGNLTFITTEGSAISSYNGSSNNHMCCISIGTHGLYGSQIYSANTNTNEVYTNMKSYIMPSNAGKITKLKDLSVVQNTGFYVNLTPYIKYIPATEAWICIDNEISVGESEPTGQEKLWIDDEYIETEDVNITQKVTEEIEKQTKLEVIPNTEIATNEYIDGKRVYIKQLEFTDTLVGGNSFTKAHGITGASRIWIDLSNSYMYSPSGKLSLPLPVTCYYGNFNDRVSLMITDTNIIMYSDTNWADNWTKVIRLKYIK